jgi:DNA-binding winged helix-turn-helix (wHTH) protein/tetratricopeptide (TPR) repeat protein
MAASADQKTKQLYEFGPFRLDAEKELLLRDQETVPLAPKAFQVLLVLIRRKQEVVTKDELLKAVWPDTFVEETNLSRNVFLLRKALGESPQDHQYIVTVPGRGYRFAEDVQFVPEEVNIVAASRAKVEVRVEESKPWGWIAVAAVLLTALGFGAYKLFVHRRSVLNEKDTIVLADFANSTGDPVFDGTLRQGLSVALEQSPFLVLISDQRIQQTLKLMDQPSDTRLTPQIAQDLCQRTQSAAYLTGSIASLGNQYVVGVKAVSCVTGDVLADEQETASGKEKTLGALDKATNRLRAKLGESFSSVQKFDTPLEQATTPSLDALQAYTLGRKTQYARNDWIAAIPFYQRAIRFDPNFAIAYEALGGVYWNLGEYLLGEENGRKAFELRSSASEQERLSIESFYYKNVTGDLEKAHQIYDTWTQTFPRNPPRVDLWHVYFLEGRYEAGLPQIRVALRLHPWNALSAMDLVSNLIFLGRLQEAHKIAQQAIARGLDSPYMHLGLYRLAFLENDTSEMARQADLVAGRPDPEAKMFEQRARTAAYYGHLKESRNLWRRAVESTMRAKESELAANYAAQALLQEALFGNISEVRLRSKASPGNPTGKIPQFARALNFAFAGDSTRVQLLADDLAKRYPADTLVQFNLLPPIRAQIALSHHDPSKAIELLQPAAPYELSNHLWWGFLGPVYVRGEAYLMSGKGPEAANEFQKILGHRGIVDNSPTGALAYLQLGRAYALSGENAKAKNAYREFLTLWKDADPDIPVLQHAKLEYAKLK